MSKEYNVAVIVGSLRKESFNRKFADALVKLAPQEFSFKHLQIGDLPLYNQDDDDNQAASVKRLKSEVSSADGLLFVTPEYNRSIPGVLKTRWITALGLTGKAHGPGSPQALSAYLRALLARRWRSNICATSSRISMSRHWANPKPLSR